MSRNEIELVLDHRAYERGSRYKIAPVDGSFEALYVPDLVNIGIVLRQFPEKHFWVQFLDGDRGSQ